MSFRIVDQRTGQAVLAPVGQRLIVGRDTPGSLAHVRCNDPHVSRRHCELEALRDGRLCVLDVSTYGTWINDQRVLRQGWARPGDRLRLGHTYQLFVEAAPPAFSPGAPGGDAGATVAADPRASSSGPRSQRTSTNTRNGGKIVADRTPAEAMIQPLPRRRFHEPMRPSSSPMTKPITVPAMKIVSVTGSDSRMRSMTGVPRKDVPRSPRASDSRKST